MSSVRTVWLGYRRTGARMDVREDEMGHGMALLGHGAGNLAALFAYASHDAGVRTLVLDLDGRVSMEVSGYLDSYDISYFLYDACTLQERAGTHGQLAASAYTSALNLSFEHEAILNASMQKIAAEKGVASPSGVIGFLGASEGFRSNSVDQLRGRLAYLKSLDIIGETGVTEQMFRGSCIADFSRIEPPEAAELGAALLLAKLLTLQEGKRPEAVVITEAHKLFPFHAVVNHSARLLNALLSASRMGKVFASELAGSLDGTLIGSCAARVVSSSVWNKSTEGLLLTPNMFMVQDTSYGNSEPFIPRPFEVSRREPKTGAAAVESEDDRAVVMEILKAIEGGGATRLSLVGWLSAEYQRDVVERTLDRLRVEGLITSDLVDVHADNRLPALALTESGRRYLEGMH